MSSYILFSQTSTALGTRDKWTDAADSGGIQAPGNTAASSTFSADQIGSPLLDTVGEQADYAADGIRKDSTTALFDISQTAGGAFTANGASGAAAVDALDGGGPLFSNASSQVATSTVDAITGTLHLSQSDANWNGIKNLEIMLDAEATFRDIRLENFVDTRLRLGDDGCLVGKRQFDTYDVQLLGVKRGEVDGTFAEDNIDLRIDVWSNEKVWQNSFDLKGSVYGDSFEIGAGNVTGSSFKSAPTTHDGTGTTVFSNMGAGDDVFDSTVSAGFKGRDKVWGGTGDDTISTGAGDDKIFGDNGSGSDFYKDPASLTTPAAFDFRTAVIPAAASNDFGDFTVEAVGGLLSKVGNASFGGLSVRSASDVGDHTAEIDAFNDTPEAVKITFDAAVQGAEVILNLFFNASAFFEDITEKMNFKVTLADGSTSTGSRLAVAGDPPATPPFPPEGTGVLVLKFDAEDFGGKLIKSIEVAPDTGLVDKNGKPVSEFVVAGVEYCTPIAGAVGNDVLNAGTGADFVQGDGDTGSFTAPGQSCINFITGAALSGFSVDIGPAQATAVGGSFAKVGDGATFGGLSILSASDALGTFTQEIDAFNDGVQEGVIFAFDSAIAGFDMDLNLFFGDTFFEPLAEVANYIIHIQGGPDIFGTLVADDLDAPGLLSFRFDTGDTGGKLITGFEIRPSLDTVAGKPYSEFTIAKLCVDDIMQSTAGDRIDLGVDSDKDTVNFNDGDGFDVVTNFNTAHDCVRMKAGEAITKSVVVDATHGVGTLIQHGADGDGVFLVGVVNDAAVTIITF